jgi:hypothetical protein
MPRKKSLKESRYKTIGIEAIVEPGVGAVYTRGAWMRKLNDLGKKRKLTEKRQQK